VIWRIDAPALQIVLTGVCMCHHMSWMASTKFLCRQTCAPLCTYICSCAFRILLRYATLRYPHLEVDYRSTSHRSVPHRPRFGPTSHQVLPVTYVATLRLRYRLVRLLFCFFPSMPLLIVPALPSIVIVCYGSEQRPRHWSQGYVPVSWQCSSLESLPPVVIMRHEHEAF
jgi:hypothetical protein